MAKYWHNITNSQDWDKNMSICEKDEVILHWVNLIQDNISTSKNLEKILSNFQDQKLKKILAQIFASKNNDISNIEAFYEILKKDETHPSQQEINFSTFRSILNTLYPSEKVIEMKNFCNEKIKQLYQQKIESKL